MKRLLTALGIVVIGAAVVIAGDLLPHHRRAVPTTRVPGYAYVRKSPTNPVTQKTFSGELLSVIVGDPAVTPADQQVPRFWQMQARELRHAHCAISQVTFWVQPNGEWRLSLVAEQNPFTNSGLQALPESRFLRNQFFVKVRALGAEKAAIVAGEAELAGPEMFCIEIPPFWMERGQRRQHSWRGTLPQNDVARAVFVDRLAIDFSWE